MKRHLLQRSNLFVVENKYLRFAPAGQPVFTKKRVDHLIAHKTLAT